MVAGIAAHKQKALQRLQPMVQLFSMQKTVSLSPFLVQRWSINKSVGRGISRSHAKAEIESRACYHHVDGRGVSAVGKWETPPKSPSSSVQTALVQVLDICPTNERLSGYSFCYTSANSEFHSHYVYQGSQKFQAS